MGTKNKIQNEIETVAGTAIFVKTLSDKELWAGDYSTKNGYWVIHRGAQHHVYKVKMADGPERCPETGEITCEECTSYGLGNCPHKEEA